jgi:uncharacterized protein (DUF1501 family)
MPSASFKVLIPHTMQQIRTFNVLTRRSFMSHSFKLGLGVALSTLVDIPMVMKRALAQGIGQTGPNGRVKKLLFIWLRGANDGLNSVIPIQDPAYASSRPNIRIPSDPGFDYSALGPCFDPTVYANASATVRAASDPTYSYANAIPLGNGFAALHPSLKFLAPVYNAGDLALVHRTAYPKQSRSHFDSQNYWENGSPNNNSVKDGIFYRAMIASGLANNSPLTGVSVQSSLPLILRGSAAPMTNLTDPTRYDLLGVPTPSGDNKALAALREANDYPAATKLSRQLLSLQYQNMSSTLSIFASLNFGDSGNTFRDEIKTDGDVDWRPSGQTSNDADGYYLFPTSNNKNGGYARPGGTTDTAKYVVSTGSYSFFNNLKAAAMILNKTDAIITGTELGGFDTHQNQGSITGSHANLQRTIGWAIYGLRKYFTRYADKAAWDDVVVVTLSEFGRTTVENSDLGTDHAEAGPMFVAGGGIKGYSAGNPSGVFNCGPNDPVAWVPGPSGSMFGASSRYLKRTTDFRSVLGEIIRKHLGASDAQMATIIPGYVSEPELKNQAVTASKIDGTQITGEVGIL